MKGSRLLRTIAALLLLLVASAGVARADSGMNMSGMSMATPAPAPTVTDSTAPIRVVLTLSEFHIDVTPKSMPAIHVGQPVELVIVNAGQLPHELMVMAPDMAGMKGMSMSAMDAMSLLTVETTNLPPGGAPVIKTITFPSTGDWMVECQLPGHEGMKATITVS